MNETEKQELMKIFKDIAENFNQQTKLLEEIKQINEETRKRIKEIENTSNYFFFFYIILPIISFFIGLFFFVKIFG